MLVLDTDHFSELERNSAAGQRLTARLEGSPTDKGVTIITIEEHLRGWLAEISRRPNPTDQVIPYAKLRRQVEAFNDWIILPFDADAARRFSEFRRQGIRIGSMDLKIACIALTYDVILLTRNSSDFSRVPGLHFENWID